MPCRGIQYHWNAFEDVKELFEKHPRLNKAAEELTKYIDKYLPLEKLASGIAKGDNLYLEYLATFAKALFESRAKLKAIEHPEK